MQLINPNGNDHPPGPSENSVTATGADEPAGRKGRRNLNRWLLAGLLPLAALALQWLLWERLQPYVWLFFYPAVFLSSWVGGRVAGLLATAFSAVVVWYLFIPPRYSFSLVHPSTIIALLIFAGMGVLFSLFHERLRRAGRQTRLALAEAILGREHLEHLMEERTRELVSLVDELRRKEADLRRSQELAKIGSWTYQADGRLEWSDELYRIYGLARGKFTPDVPSFLEIIHPDDRAHMQHWVKACLGGENPGELEFRIVRPDGSVRFISGHGALSRDSEGRVTGMSGTGQDITERKIAESAHRESEELLKLFIEYAPVPLAMFDREMRYLYASRRWRSDFGLGDRSLVKVSHYAIFPEIPQHWRELHRRGLAGEILREEAEEFRRADGTVQWLRWELRPWYDAGGKVGGIVIFSEDISNRKCAEDALQKLNEELELRVAQRTETLDVILSEREAQNAELQRAYHELEAETARRIRMVEELRQKEQLLIHQSRLAAMGEMLGYIAHQWRQPLNVLGLHLQVLGLSYQHGTFSRELLEESVGKAMGIIRHLSRTIDDFRDFLILNKEKTLFQVDEVIVKTVGLIEEHLKKAGVRIEVACTNPPEVNGFPNEYSHVILNLLTNAKDAFLERQTEHPVIRVHSGSEQGKTVVTIADNAGGIPEEIIDKIFDAYFTTKGLGKGSGVGLFMSKMIIEKNMGGSLTVRNVNGGAEFRIEI
uniref:histidine kinase n=1 Tax=Geobacter sp. (strain M21) TaxID=443144 RepID=C6DZP1_GEOSM